MNNKKLILLIIMGIFCIGITMNSIFAVDDSNLTERLSLNNDSTPIGNLNSTGSSDITVNLSMTQDFNHDNDQNESFEVSSADQNSQEGILSSSGSAGGHTYTVGKYTFTLTDSQYKQVKNYKVHYVYLKTNHHKIVKIPKYKTKKVTSYKWKYSYVKAWKWDFVFGEYKSYKTPQKYKKWKYVGDESERTGRYEIGYHVFKKKVKHTATKKVKTGYKKVKATIFAKVGMGGDGRPYVYYYSGKSIEDPWYEVLGWKSFDF